MHKIFEWMKAHPWLAGILIVGGGLTFIVLSGWFGGDSSSSGNTSAGTSGPSPAQLAAQAQLAGAQIAGQVATHNTDVAASLKLNEDTLAAALGSKALDNQSQLQKQNYFATINGQQLSAADAQAQRALQSEIANEQYQLEYHDQNLRSDQEAHQYVLDYRTLVNQSQQEADNATITQQLLARIPQAQVG